jgi:hypothetical protein
MQWDGFHDVGLVWFQWPPFPAAMTMKPCDCEFRVSKGSQKCEDFVKPVGTPPRPDNSKSAHGNACQTTAPDRG